MPTPYQLPDGRWVNLPDDPAARAELERAIASRYPGSRPSTIDPNASFLSSIDPFSSQRPPAPQQTNGADEGNILGSAWQGIKQIPFGLLDVPLSIAESIIGVATPHKDYDVEKWLRRVGDHGQKYIDPKYADAFLPKVGMGVGQVAGMLLAGLTGTGIGGILGGGAKAAQIGGKLFGFGSGISLNISEQVRKMADHEQRTGRRISAPKQTAAHALAALVGLTEHIALKGYVPKAWQQRMGWSKAANKLVSGGIDAVDEKKLMSILIPRLKELGKVGAAGVGAEAIQEAAQQFLQSGISRGLYDPNAMDNIFASMAEDAKVGGAVGGIAGVFMDLLSNGLTGGRRRGSTGPRGARDVVEGQLARGNENAERQVISDRGSVIKKDNTGILKHLVSSDAFLDPKLEDYGGIELEDESVESIDRAIGRMEIARAEALERVDALDGYKPGEDGMSREELKRNINTITDENIGDLVRARKTRSGADENQFNETISAPPKNVPEAVWRNTLEKLGTVVTSFVDPILSGDTQGFAYVPGAKGISKDGALDVNAVNSAWGDQGIQGAFEFINETGARADLGLGSAVSELKDRPLNTVREELLQAERKLSEVVAIRPDEDWQREYADNQKNEQRLETVFGKPFSEITPEELEQLDIDKARNVLSESGDKEAHELGTDPTMWGGEPENIIYARIQAEERVSSLENQLKEAETARMSLDYKPGAISDNARVTTGEVASVMMENGPLANPDEDFKLAEMEYEDGFWTSSPTKVASDTKIFAQYSMFSGGAKGADLAWGEIAEEFGVGSAGVEEGYGVRHIRANEMTPAHIEEAHPHVMKAGESLGRTYPMKPNSKRSPEKTEYANNLLRRNYFQVKNADAVFAVGNLNTHRPHPFTPVNRPDHYVVNGLEAKGGTGWAVRMAIDQGKPVYLFDQSSRKWYTGDNRSRRRVGIPRLTPNFAGIGTRDLTESGKDAIRDVFVRSTYPEVEASTPQIGAWPEPGASIPGLPQAIQPPLEFRSNIKKDEQIDDEGNPLWAGNPSMFSNFAGLGEFGFAPAEEARGEFDFGMPYEDSLLGPVRAKTVEHAYQAQKFDNREIREQIYALETPAEAKKIVKNLPGRKDFSDAEAKAIMKDIVRQKFAAGTSFRELLKSIPLSRKIEEKAGGKDSRWRRIMREIFDELRLEILEDEGVLKKARETTIDVISNMVKDLEEPEELEFAGDIDPGQMPEVTREQAEGRIKTNISELNNTEFTDYVANQMEITPGLVLLINAAQKVSTEKQENPFIELANSLEAVTEEGRKKAEEESKKEEKVPDYELSDADVQAIRDFIEIHGKPQAAIVPKTVQGIVAGTGNSQVVAILEKLGIERAGTDERPAANESGYTHPSQPNSPIASTDTGPYWEELTKVTGEYRQALDKLDKILQVGPQYLSEERKKIIKKIVNKKGKDGKKAGRKALSRDQKDWRKSSWDLLDKSDAQTELQNLSVIAGESKYVETVVREPMPLPLSYEDKQKMKPGATHLSRPRITEHNRTLSPGNVALLKRLVDAKKIKGTEEALAEVGRRIRSWEGMVVEKSFAWKRRNSEIISELAPTHFILLGKLDNQSGDLVARRRAPELKQEEDRLLHDLRIERQSPREIDPETKKLIPTSEEVRLLAQLEEVQEGIKEAYKGGGYLTPALLAMQKDSRTTLELDYSRGRVEGDARARTVLPRQYRHKPRMNVSQQIRRISNITRDLDKESAHDIGPRAVTDQDGELREETREEYAARIEQEIGPLIERNDRIGVLKFDRNRALAELFTTVLHGAKRLLIKPGNKVGLGNLWRRMGFKTENEFGYWLNQAIQKSEKALDVYNHFDYMTRREIDGILSGLTPEAAAAQGAEITQKVTTDRKQYHMPRAAVLDATDTVNISKILHDKDSDARKASDSIFDMLAIANFTNWMGRKGIDSREGFAEKATAEVLDGFMERQKKSKTVKNSDIEELLNVKNILLRSDKSWFRKLVDDVAFGFESVPFVKFLKDMTGADSWKGASNAQKRLMYSKLLSLPSYKGSKAVYLPSVYDQTVLNQYKERMMKRMLPLVGHPNETPEAARKREEENRKRTEGLTVDSIYRDIKNDLEGYFKESDFDEALTQLLETDLVQESDLQVLEKEVVPYAHVLQRKDESKEDYERRKKSLNKEAEKSRKNYIKLLKEDEREAALREKNGEPPLQDRTKSPFRRTLRFSPDTKGSEWVHEALPKVLEWTTPEDPAFLESIVRNAFAEFDPDGERNPFFTLLRNEPRELMSQWNPELGPVLEKVRLELNPDLVQSSRGMVPPPVMVLAGGPLMYEEDLSKLLENKRKGRKRKIEEIGKILYRDSDLRKKHLTKFLKDAIELDGMPRLVKLPDSKNKDVWKDVLSDLGVPEEAIVEVGTPWILSYAQKKILTLAKPTEPKTVRVKPRGRLLGRELSPSARRQPKLEKYKDKGQTLFRIAKENRGKPDEKTIYEDVPEDVGRETGIIPGGDFGLETETEYKKRADDYQEFVESEGKRSGINTPEKIILYIKRAYSALGVPMPKLPDGQTHGTASRKYWLNLADKLTYIIRDRRLLGLPERGAVAMGERVGRRRVFRDRKEYETGEDYERSKKRFLEREGPSGGGIGSMGGPLGTTMSSSSLDRAADERPQDAATEEAAIKAEEKYQRRIKGRATVFLNEEQVLRASDLTSLWATPPDPKEFSKTPKGDRAYLDAIKAYRRKYREYRKWGKDLGSPLDLDAVDRASKEALEDRSESFADFLEDHGIQLERIEDPELQGDIEDLRKQWQRLRLDEEEGYRSEPGLDRDFQEHIYEGQYLEEDPSGIRSEVDEIEDQLSPHDIGLSKWGEGVAETPSLDRRFEEQGESIVVGVGTSNVGVGRMWETTPEGDLMDMGAIDTAFDYGQADAWAKDIREIHVDLLQLAERYLRTNHNTNATAARELGLDGVFGSVQTPERLSTISVGKKKELLRDLRAALKVARQEKRTDLYVDEPIWETYKKLSGGEIVELRRPVLHTTGPKKGQQKTWQRKTSHRIVEPPKKSTTKLVLNNDLGPKTLIEISDRFSSIQGMDLLDRLTDSQESKNKFTELQNLVNEITGIPLTRKEFVSNYNLLLSELSSSDMANMGSEDINRLAKLLSAKTPSPRGSLREGVYNVSAEGLGQEKSTIVPNDPNDTTRHIRKEVNEINSRFEEADKEVRKTLREIGADEDVVVEYVADLHSLWQLNRDVAVSGEAMTDEVQAVYDRIGNRIIINLSMIDPYDHLSTAQILREAAFHEGIHHLYLTSRLSNREIETLFKYVEKTVVDESIDPEANRLGQTYYQWKAIDPRYANLNMRDLKMEAVIDVLAGLASGNISPKKSAGAIGTIKNNLIRFLSAFMDPAKESGITPVVAILNKVMSGEVGARDATALAEGIAEDVDNSVLAGYAVPEELDALKLAVQLSKESKTEKERIRYEAEAEAIIKKITEVREAIKRDAPDPPDELKQIVNTVKMEEINADTGFGGTPFLNSVDQLQYLVNKYGPEFIEAHAWALDEYIKMRENPEYSGYTMPSKFSTMLRKAGSIQTDVQRELTKKNIADGHFSASDNDGNSIKYLAPLADGQSVDETTSTFLDWVGQIRQNFIDTREKFVRQAGRLMKLDQVAYQQADSSALVAIRWHDQVLSFMPGLLGYGPPSYITEEGAYKGDYEFVDLYDESLDDEGAVYAPQMLTLPDGTVVKNTEGKKVKGLIPGLEDMFHDNLTSDEDVVAASAYGVAQRIRAADEAMGRALTEWTNAKGGRWEAEMKETYYKKRQDLHDLIQDPDTKKFHFETRDKKGNVTESWEDWVKKQIAVYGQNEHIVRFWKYAHAFNKKMLRFAYSTEDITREQYHEWSQKKWTPFYSDTVDDTEMSPFTTFAGARHHGNLIEKAIRGGPQMITGDLKGSMERAYRAIIRDGTQNVAVRRMNRDTVRLGEAKIIDPGDPELSEGSPIDDASIVRSMNKGVPEFHKYDDVEYAKSVMIGGVNPRAAIAQFFGGGVPGDLVAKAFIGMAQVLRETVTRMPPYMFRNLTRDAMDADVTLGNGPPLWFAAIKNAFTPGSLERAARMNLAVGLDVMSHGGVGQGVYEARFRKQLGDVNWLNPWSAVAAVWQGLGRMASQSEVAVRLAIYDRVMSKDIPNMTLAQKKSMARSLALELLNFGRRGANPFARTFLATVPFMNGRIAGMDKLARVGFSKTLDAPDLAVLMMSPEEQRAYWADPKNKGKQIWKRRRLAMFRRGLMLATMSGIYYALMHDNEEYKLIREETRTDNWLIPMTKTRWLKMPIPFEIGVLFKVIPEQMMKLIMEKETDISDVSKQMKRQLRNSLSIGPPQLIAPFIDAIRNNDAYRGDFIVDPITNQIIEPSEQKTRYTSNVAKGLAKITNAVPLVNQLDFLTSPQKLEYIMRQFLGTAGSYGIIVADRMARHGIIPFVEAENVVGTTYDFDWGSLIGGEGMENVPLLGDLFMDPRRGNENVQTLYEMVREMDRFVATKGRITEGNWREGMDYMHENLQYEAWQNELRSLERTMANVTEHKEFIMDRNDINDDEKRVRIRRVTEVTNRILGRIQDLRVTLRRKPQVDLRQ